MTSQHSGTMVQHLNDLRLETPDDIRRLLMPKIKPSWEHVVVQELTGGFSHRMYLCYEAGHQEDSIVVRLRNVFNGSVLVNADFEFRVLQVLVENQLFPEVLASFTNGYAYQYIEGKTLLVKDRVIITNELIRKIACKLRTLHSLKIPKHSHHEDSSVFQRLIRVVETNFREPLPRPLEKCSPQDFVKELKVLERRAESLRGDKVLCHGDCHLSNMIQKQLTDEVVFVDFEWTHVGYRAEDLGFFLQMLHLNDTVFDLEILAPIDYETKFLEYYLASGTNETCQDLPSLESFREQTNLFKLVCPLFVAILSIAHPDLASQLTEDMNSFLMVMFGEYFRMRKDVLKGLEPSFVITAM